LVRSRRSLADTCDGAVLAVHRRSNAALNKTILVVDDDPDCLTLVADYLSHRGHTVIVASAAREALRMLKQSSLEPDLVVADLAMPGMDGVTFVEELRNSSRLAAIPIVIMSAFGEAEAPTPRGARARFQKPLDLDALQACVARA
jgi:CheY-like chemotaxis protein